MRHQKSFILCASILTTIITGCASANPSQVASNTPPRIVTNFSSGVNVWDYASSFGPVPQSLQATGDKLCRDIGLQGARGYHPRAEQLNGKPFDGGGYLCGGSAG